MPSNTSEKQFITHERGNRDAWACLCGNQPDYDGFYTCDCRGDEVEPEEGKWDDLYVCARCGRIIHQDTLEVVGQNPNWKALE
jgi:hypothetical protein